MPPRKQGPMQKPKNAFGAFKRILSYMAEYKALLMLVVVFIICSSLANVIGTSFLQKIIDNYLTPLIKDSGNAELYRGFMAVLGQMMLVYVIGALCTFGYSRIMLNISTKTLFKIRTDLFTHMETLPIKYFDTHTHGELMSRYTNDIDTIREMLSNAVSSFISSAVTIIGVFVMMVYYSWQLTLVSIGMLFVILFLTGKIGGKSGKYFKEQQKEIGAVNGYIEEMIDGQKVVKVFVHEKQAKEEFEQLNDRLCEASTNANTFANILGPVNNNLGHVQYALTAVVGGILAIKGVHSFSGPIMVGTVVAFLQYTRNFSMPISQVSQLFNSVLSALAGAERIFNMIDEPSEVDDGYVTLVNAKEAPDGTLTECSERTGVWAWKHPHKADGTITYTKVQGRVEFDDVTFGYEENKTVLNGISLYAKPGQKIAFVGSTGAGKTTITNLINRFYDVPDGKIRYDGININKIKKDDLRRSLSMVLQDTHLFTGTVMDNIRYGKLDATDEEVIKAAKLANADSFIRHLPEGYDTMLYSDGANLSQGQRQLLAIARAAVADPPVLILDEATSSIDTRTEALIEKGMDSLMEGRTVFVIAHRLSTVRNSDAIMVLEHGNIIERGNHDALIADHGKYYQLYTGMFELS
ncbi:aBC-type multidrug transport system ATPase and permease components [Ruminococcus sp. CAG:353]|nr:ABC transporter ATP-binding protein [Ruminococcus sp.]CDE80457.1 aBC-type multidrug transport system ATPase and permease components [Ruminococcus sp. CAG:353]